MSIATSNNFHPIRVLQLHDARIEYDGQLKVLFKLFYKSSLIDEDDYLAVSNGFCCNDCGDLIEHCGVNIEVEKDLLDYFATDPELLEQQEKDYEAHIDAQASTQEQRKKEQEFYDNEMADMSVEMGL